MRKVKTFAAALCLLAASAVSASAQGAGAGQGAAATKSLYERLGGLDAITAVVDEFIKIAGADERVNKKFARSEPNFPRIRLHLIEQVCAATGGPCKYTGLSMKQAHKNMGVTEGEWSAGVEDLVKALDKFNVPSAEKTELLNILGPLKDQIVEVKGNETGTALPANFKPAKPMTQEQIKAGPAMKGGTKKAGDKKK